MNAQELFFATIQSGNVTNLKSQLSHNPDIVNVKDSRGFTPLIFATYFDKEDISKLLVDHNAEIDARDASGNTALIGVCFKGNVSIANHLIAHGADLNAKNTKGVTPLIFATLYNKLEIVALLLEKGADSTITDKDEKSATDYAKEKGFVEILELLRNQ
ncbi:MAG: ankyrin repeat domain-containing protein [Winogradskyella sp.]|uniref:ankyrin repeat domain-containing protein n=1 Tax=Winogradskyella sp. TaxID=1883156 RepID=UPI00385B0A74